jgi:hypothetical protein
MPVFFAGMPVSLVTEQALVIRLRQVAALPVIVGLVNGGVGKVHVIEL